MLFVSSNLHLYFQGVGPFYRSQSLLAVDGERSSVSHTGTLAIYPNPSHTTATVAFDLSKREHVTLKVFDLLGREVAVLLNESLEKGEHSVQYIIDTSMPATGSGILFFHLHSDDGEKTGVLHIVR
jgi:hypothetical protein